MSDGKNRKWDIVFRTEPNRISDKFNPSLDINGGDLNWGFSRDCMGHNPKLKFYYIYRFGLYYSIDRFIENVY